MFILQTLRNTYLLLSADLRRIEEAVRQVDSGVGVMPGPRAEFEVLLSHLCGQMCEYIRARQKTMDLYPWTKFGYSHSKYCF